MVKINGEKLAWAIIFIILIITVVFFPGPEFDNAWVSIGFSIVSIGVGAFAVYRFIENMKEAFEN